MTIGPENEEPGFEHDVNELPREQNKGSEHTLEDNLQVGNEDAAAMEHAQEEAAEERKEGGYQ
jgi:hypothetical protein